MKKIISNLAIASLMAGLVFSGCQSSAKKVENAEKDLQTAKNNVIDARQGLYDATKDSLTEYQIFKKESQQKINDHEKSIAEFKARIAAEKLENKVAYEKKIAELEKKNSDLKRKLEEYKEDGQTKWAEFKTKFSHDMSELGQAFKNFTIKSEKK